MPIGTTKIGPPRQTSAGRPQVIARSPTPVPERPAGIETARARRAMIARRSKADVADAWSRPHATGMSLKLASRRRQHGDAGPIFAPRLGPHRRGGGGRGHDRAKVNRIMSGMAGLHAGQTLPWGASSAAPSKARQRFHRPSWRSAVTIRQSGKIQLASC